MNMHTWIQKLGPKQVATFAEDFGRFLQRGPHSRKHRLVLALAQSAGEAGRSGDDVRGAFMHGMAAAIYGVSRLAEAKELEDIVRPRLERPDSAAEHSLNQASHKEHTMLDTVQDFSLQDVAEHFKADGLHHTLDEDRGVITTQMRMGSLGFVHIVAHVANNTMTFVHLLPVSVPERKRANMAEAVARTNYGLAIGSFEMDYEDGELTFRVSFPTDDATVSLSQHRHCIAVSLATIAHFMPVFLRIIFNDAAPDEVMHAREKVMQLQQAADRTARRPTDKGGRSSRE